MTTPASPRGQGDPNVVEMDAIDGAEWERDQHTPPAPAAGLAALVRQTAAPPVVEETRSMRPPAKQVRRQPPKPPAGSRILTPPVGSRMLTPPGLSPLLPVAAARALPLAPPAPDASPLPIASTRPAPQEVPITFEDVTVPMGARQQAVLLPLQAPSTGPVVNPSPLTSLPIATNTLPAVPDHTPAARVQAPTPDELADRAPSPSLTPWYGSLRMLALIGGAITAVLIAGAIILIAGPSSPPQRTASTPAESAPDRRPPLPPRPAPVRPPATDALQEPSPTTMPGHAIPVTPPPVAVATRTRVEPTARITERPDRGDRRPHAAKPLPTLRGTRKAAVPMLPTLAEMNADDEPAIAQARAAYFTGNQLLFDGDFTAAIQSYRKAVDYAPNYAAGFRGLGLAYAVQGDSAAALQAFRSYLGLVPHAKDVALIKRRIAGLQSSHH